MTNNIAKSFSPAGISSFFEICDRTDDGKPIKNLEKVGARGGGFGLKKGVLTKITAIEKEKTKIQIFINGKFTTSADTTKAVIEAFLAKTEKKFKIIVDHKVEIPIGAGFGTSAGGALSTGLALSRVLNMNLTYNQIGRIAHKAEIEHKTGLGTVGPLMIGGCALTIEPGAPGISVIDRIPLTDEHVIVSGVIKPIPTIQILNSEKKRKQVNLWGKKTLDQILLEPSAKNFMNCSLNFAE